MGIYLNPDNDNFIDVLNTGIYVDKTLLIDETNKIILASEQLLRDTIAGNENA